MRDAIGGTVNIAIVIFLIALLSGYLAFSVNYTKAFRVKNEIINYIEEYEGFDCNNSSNMRERIKQYIDSQHYKLPNNYMNYVSNELSSNPENKYFCDTEGGYCVMRNISIPPKNGNTTETALQGSYYTVVTFVNIEVPIIQNIFQAIATQFNVRGDTRVLYPSENHSELGTGSSLCQ